MIKVLRRKNSMLIIYAVMTFIIANLTLFLNWKASNTRRSPVPALKAAALLLAFALISLTIPGSIQAPNPQSGENCVGNVAIWETTTAALNVTPCIVDSTQIINGEAYYVQLANLTWKGTPQTIDLAFKFPILMSHSGLDLWQNTSHPKIVSNCTSSHQQFNNATNSSLYNITTTTCNPYTNQDFYFDWANKNGLITHVEHATGQYYALQGITAATNQLFQARLLFAKKDVGFGNVWKWSLFGKLNSDSISTAISTSRYSELDPAVNATAFNITSQADTNTSVPDFAPFCDGKFLMGAGNRSNVTGCDSFGDQNYNANPDWKAYALRTGAGTCPLNISASTSSLFMENTDISASTCAIEAIRSVNVSVPKEAGIIISWLQNKSTASLNFEAGMCFVYDATITNDTTGRCNGGDDMFFITSDNADNFLYGKGGVPNQGFGTSGQATQHFEVWINESHVKSCVSGVCSALGAFATTNKVQSGYVVLMIFNNLGGPAEANFFNITIANATQFGQPFNFTPARFETILMNDTAVVDKIKITNTTYKTAGAQATFFAMDNNSQNQQSVTEGSFVDITDFNGLKINATFTPQNINTTSEITSFLVELSTITNTASTCIWKYPSNNAVIYSGNVSLNASCTDPEADPLTYYWYINGTLNKTTNAINTSINFTKGNYVANISAADATLFAPNVTITFDLTSNITLIITTLQNLTPHSENISAQFNDPDGAADIVNYSVSTTSGNCNQLANVSSGNLKNFSFNCTGSGLVAHTVTVTVNDTAGNVSKAVFQNAYPDEPTFFNISFPFNNANTSLNWANITNISDADGDVTTPQVFVNGTFNQTGTNITLALTPERNYVINISISAGGNITQNQTINYQFDNLSARIANGTNDQVTSGFIKRNHVGVNYTFTELFNSTIFIRNGSRGVVTNTSPVLNATYFRFNFTSLDDANYTFSPWINDTAGNANASIENLTITVDTTPPNITLEAMHDRNNSAVNRNWITINLSIAELYNASLTINLTNSSQGVFTAQLGLNTTPSTNLFNFTSLADGRYNLSINATDKAGNANFTANYTFLIDTTPPIIENGSISPTTATVSNPFTVYANISEANVFTVTATIAGANYTMTENSPGSNRYNFTFTSTNLVGNYVVTDFYINDTAGNTHHNTTSLIFAATATQQSQGVIGGGGGGGGFVTVITPNGTIQVILNGTFQAKPAAIERYDAYFPSGDGKKTWRFKAEANAAVKACITTGGFYCTIGGTEKTEVTIKKDYQLSGLSNTYEGTVTLLSQTGDNAFKIPVKFTAINLGATLPINVPGLHVLPSALAWQKPEANGSAQPRIWPLLLLASSGSLPFLNKAITRRKLKRKQR